MVESRGWSKNKYYHRVGGAATKANDTTRQRAVEDLLSEWRRSRDLGVGLHGYMESVLRRVCRGSDLGFLEDDVTGSVNALDASAVRSCVRYVIEVLKWRPVAAELPIFDEEASIAGTVDALFVDPTGSPVLLDWKRAAVSTGDVYGKCLQYPGFSSYGNSRYWKYAFQLNFYRVILARKYNLRAREMYVIAFPPDTGTFEVLGIPIVLHIDDHYQQIVEGVNNVQDKDEIK